MPTNNKSKVVRVPPGLRRPEEKSILIQTYRYADPSEVEICREMDWRCLLQSDPVFDFGYFERCKVPSCYSHKNVWYLITGNKISQIFQNLPQDEPIYSRDNPTSVQIGSHLYEIGGRGSTGATSKHCSQQIRFLNTANPSAGWKSLNPLPIYCANAVAQACGRFIYLFPRFFGFLMIPNDHASEWPACVYDTIEQTAYKLESPFGPEKYRFSHRVYAPLDGRGIIVPVAHEDYGQILYLHKPEVNCWERLDHYSPIPKGQRYAVSNGILYVCDQYDSNYSCYPVLYAYDLRKGRLICKIQLPEFDEYDPEAKLELFLVAVSDFELGFLWSRIPSYLFPEEETSVFYVEVLVSLHPPMAHILSQTSFQMDCNEVLNYMLLM